MNPDHQPAVRTGASRASATDRAVAELAAALRQPDAALVVVFAAPRHDRAALAEGLAAAFPGVLLIGCTTAGEIGAEGLVEGGLTGFSLARSAFEVDLFGLDDLLEASQRASAPVLGRLSEALEDRGRSAAANAFGFLLVDGLCTREEGVVGALGSVLGPIPLFGGSAGDGLDFECTWILQDGAWRTNAAVLALVRTELPFEVFKSQHFTAGAERLVVTGTVEEQRLVTELNGGPAAEEYAAALGIDVDELCANVYFDAPLVLRLGGVEYLRAIKAVRPDGGLEFFCALEMGSVLAIARAGDLVGELERSLDALRTALGPELAVIGCDCINRRLEIQRDGLERPFGAVCAQYGVVGFSTYGEQFNGMHVNQTFTGVAIGLEPRGRAA